jgi:hypothetical protein
LPQEKRTLPNELSTAARRTTYLVTKWSQCCLLHLHLSPLLLFLWQYWIHLVTQSVVDLVAVLTSFGNPVVLAAVLTSFGNNHYCCSWSITQFIW